MIFTFEQTEDFINDERNGNARERVFHANHADLVIQLGNNTNYFRKGLQSHHFLELLVDTGDICHKYRVIWSKEEIAKNGTQETKCGNLFLSLSIKVTHNKNKNSSLNPTSTNFENLEQYDIQSLIKMLISLIWLSIIVAKISIHWILTSIP